MPQGHGVLHRRAASRSIRPRSTSKGFKVATLSTRRNDPQAINPAVKSLNYLNNVMGALELRGRDVNEGLFLTTAGYVCECTADNFFLVKGHKLMTPHPALGALRASPGEWS